MKKQIYYIYSKELLEISRNISNIYNRAYVVQSLIASYNLISKCEVIEGERATDEDILSFHCREYLEYLKQAQHSSNLEVLTDDKKTDDFNLCYDCPLFSTIYDYVQLIAGSSLTAARKLIPKGKCKVFTSNCCSRPASILPRSYLKFRVAQVEPEGDVYEWPEKLTISENIKLVEDERFKSMNKYSSVEVNSATEVKSGESNQNYLQNIAINWFGGWHHAQRDAAEGFCYVNDIVIAILFLLRTFNRILYIDLDIHHGNGVENAFVFSPRVLVLSFHKYQTGFYPSTGSVNDIGLGNGKYYTINVPLKDGVNDAVYIRIFSTIFEKVCAKYKPECVVVQCGADSITGDPLGGFNLTPLGLGHCLRLIIRKELPTLVLGGGGYNVPNVARCWTYLTSVVLDYPLSNDIPDNSYFHLFGPDFELSLSPTLRKNENSDEYVQLIVDTVTRNLECLPCV